MPGSVFACQVYTVNFTSYNTIKEFKSKKLQSERRAKRVSIGWWLFRLTVKILANLRLAINIFLLFSPETFFTVNFFHD